MKEWWVYAKDEPGKPRSVFICFEAWDERGARAWMKEHEAQINTPGHGYEGATLELVEFESYPERIERERNSYREALRLAGENAALRARVAELEAAMEEEKRETDCWRAKARDKGASSRAAAAQRDRLRSVLESTTTALDDLANAMAQASADCSQTPGCWDPTGKITVARYETEDALDAARKALKENA